MATLLRVMHTDQKLSGLQQDSFAFDGEPAVLALAYISPQVDFAAVVTQLKRLCGPTPLIAVSTAGELCANTKKAPLYISTAEQPDSVVVQLFPPDLLQAVQIVTVPLYNADIRNGSFLMDSSARIGPITKELMQVKLDFVVDARDTVALTFIDGLSSCENYVMEAIYRSKQFPCMFVGGSSGGKLDFKHSYIYNGTEVLENHAVIVFLKLAKNRSYGVLKSQNFQDEHISFKVVDADPDRRTVHTVFDEATGEKRPFAHCIAETLGVSVGSLSDYFKYTTFAVRIGEAVYVRSVSGVNAATGAITFYCDVNKGERLHLVKAVDFKARTAADIEAFLADRPPLIGVILNDCILRRLNNDLDVKPTASDWPIPVAGFSTFGEIFGVNVNQTLSALAFFDNSKNPEWVDPFVSNFPLYYSSFYSYFEHRRAQASANLFSIGHAANPQDVDVTQFIQVGVIKADTSGTILSVNAAIETMFGYTGDEIVGRPISFLMRTVHSATDASGLRYDLKTSEGVISEGGCEQEGICKSGEAFTLHIRVTQRVENEQTRFVIMCRDISAQKKQEHLLVTEKMQALDDSHSKSTFLAHMSHELRTPLNGMLGMLQLLRETALSPEQQELANNAQISGEALLDIVNDILDISKIEAAGLTLEAIGFDVRKTMNEAVGIVRPLAHKKKLELQQAVPAQLPYMIGDPLRIRQIVMNLLSNAIKYTEQGSVTLSVQILSQTQENITLRLEVRDTGVGIAADKLDAIFDSFKQADTSTTRKYGGTGLGLAITKKLVEMMGGKIGVESALGQGSCFWCEFTLPVTESLYEARFGTEIIKGNGTLKPADVRMLVAEDTMMSVVLIKKAMAKLGITQVTYVTSGKQVLEVFKPDAWDIILMDCFMPEMTGYDASLAIRQQEYGTTSHVPIVALTANALAGDREECMRHGMDYYLAKPFKLEDLKDTLSQWIDFAS